MKGKDLLEVGLSMFVYSKKAEGVIPKRFRYKSII